MNIAKEYVDTMKNYQNLFGHLQFTQAQDQKKSIENQTKNLANFLMN